jgi:hypothetical protein
MSKQRKFNARRFFDAFHGHENELSALFAGFDRPLPEPVTTEGACRAASDDFGANEKLTPLLYQLNDIATPAGREIIEATAASFAIMGDAPGPDVTHARAALWLWNSDKDAFESAMDRLAALGVQGGQVAMFPGRSAITIADPATAVAGFETQLNENLKEWKGALGFNVRHYIDGTMLVILVFCERTAEVQWEFDHGKKEVKSGIRRPVIQDVLFYDQHTGELEIEAGHAKHREILRCAFAKGVMNDDSFFPIEECTRVLCLQNLITHDFKLPTRQGHTAIITGIKIKDSNHRKPVTMGFGANRVDVVDYLRGKDAMQLLKAGAITSVRIELVLGRGRLDRKSIELNGDNRIKFNRASHADEVYQYLRHWTIMGQCNLAEESAA